MNQKATNTDPGWSRRTVKLQILLGLGAAALAGLMLHLFWQHWGLPDHPLATVEGGARPQGLDLFVALALPAAVAVPSLVLGLLVLLLPRARAGELGRLIGRLLRLDAGTYLALPAFLLLPILWRNLGNGFLALGLVFLGLISIKSGINLVLVWYGYLSPRARQEGRWLGMRAQVALFLVVFSALGLAASWTQQAVSTASDEVGYLTLAHSLSHYGGWNVDQVVEKHQYRGYYWTRWSNRLAFSIEKTRGNLFPLIITPFYAAGGRLGVLWFFAALMGLLACLLWGWLERAGLEPTAAGASVALVLLSAPVLIVSRQVFPELPVMLLFIWGLRILASQEKRPLWSLLGLVFIAFFIALLKSRMAPLGAGLVLVGAWQLLLPRWGLGRCLLAAGLALVLGVLTLWLLPLEMWPAGARHFWISALTQWRRYTPDPWQPVAIFFRGILVDQNYGVVFAAPVFLLALAGLPAGLRLKPRLCLQVILPALLYLAVLVFARWQQWYGGFSGPGRFVAVLLPGTALFMGLSIQALNRPWLRLAVLVPAAFSLAYSWLLSLLPHYHYSRPTGVNNLVAVVERNLGFSLHHWLPTTFGHSPALIPSLVILVFAAGILAIITWRSWKRGCPEPRPLDSREVLALPLACGLLMAGLIFFSYRFPPHWLEAEQMEHRGGSLWAEWAYPPPHLRGWVMFNGNELRDRLFFPGGPVRLELMGRGELQGRLILKLEQRSYELAWPGGKGNHRVVFKLGDVPRGYHRLRLILYTCPTRACSLLVDRLELKRKD